MKNDSPLVTVILPAYNAEKYIREAVQSVINQNYEKWELLVINDGSTDKTSQIISKFNDNRIKYIKQINRGVSSARNAGLNLANGKYITFLDADDLLSSNSLIKRVDFLEFHQNIDIVDGKIDVMDSKMDKVIRTYSPYYNGKLLPRLMALDSRVFFNVCYMFKKEVLGDIRFKEKMTHAEDLLFYMELSNQNNIHYGYVSDKIYFYRSGHDSAMANLNGLETGYIQLLKKLKSLSSVTIKQRFNIRIRIACILLLSRLKNKEYMKAVSSSFKAFNFLS